MTLSRASFLVVALATASLVACGESHSGPEDAQIVFDAFFPDGGIDAGPPPSVVGARCTSDEQCGGGTYCESILDGYCTTICTSDDGCPSGSSCVQLTRTTSYCLASCEPGSEADQCQRGNGCTGGGPGLPPVCLPGCEDDSDCESGLRCEVGAGGLGAGLCIDPSRPLGGACRSDAECPPSAQCATERDADFPGGACIIFGCDPGLNRGCPDDAQCLPTQFGGGVCLDGCRTDTDCRPEYECVASESYPDRSVCQPRFVDENLGAICSAGRGSCAGGVCLTETQSFFPDSYCSVECDPSSGAGCAGVCVPTSDGGGLCLLACTEQDDCRSAYRCRNVRPEDPGSPTACFPGCTDDAQCTATRRDGTRHVCNPGTGFCVRPFNPGSLGSPCNDGADCVGGRCLTAAEGWTGGMCTYPGCRLSGDGPAATCPSGSVCTDDGGGDPELGVCVPACVVGGASCRAGYACVALDEGSTAGACRPAG